MSKKPANSSKAKSKKTVILGGIGLDNKDGHKRVTTGEQFVLVGGSEETHGRMTETAIKTFEELKHRGKHLAEVEHAELQEIIHKSTPH
ncbi:MAG: hypothetical protein QM790_09075 [Nibricoccus sp.]